MAGCVLVLRRWLKANALLAPTGLWLGFFLIAPLVVVVEFSFATRNTGVARAVLPWTTQAYLTALDPAFLPIFGRTLLYAGATTVACLLLGFPLAWFIARHGGRYRTALLAAVLIPFWSSYLARIYAWRLILAQEGALNWSGRAQSWECSRLGERLARFSTEPPRA